VTISLQSDCSPGGPLLKSLWATRCLWFTTKEGSFCSYIKGFSNRNKKLLAVSKENWKDDLDNAFKVPFKWSYGIEDAMSPLSFSYRQ
jgi:hypothetical protein